MFITMAVALFTSRAILAALGVEDFGIYNIVGGIVVIFSFISSSLRNATGRYISYELGKKDNYDIKKVFNVCIQCHFIIILILLLVTETIGLWMLHNVVNIPEHRSDVVDIVYQFSILTFIINIATVPFQSTIISYERMSFYAYLSIIEVVLKLLIVYFLYISPIDRLITYSILMSLVTFTLLSIYYYYCTQKLDLGHYKYTKDNALMKRILVFSGMSMINGGASVVSIQGGNILMNMFYGVITNAAAGIANQVSTHVYAFVSNFQSAFQPQIIKLYACKDNYNLKKLINRASLASFYLMLIISVPILYETDYILSLWLVDVPDYSSVFCRLLIISSLIDAIQAPLWMLIYGTGNIKKYTTWTSIITFLNIPIAYFLMEIGYPPYVCFLSRILTGILCSIYRVGHAKYLTDLDIKDYLKGVYIRPLIICVLIFLYCFLSYNINITSSIFNIFISFIICCILIIIIGFDTSDRTIVYNLIINKLQKK